VSAVRSSGDRIATVMHSRRLQTTINDDHEGGGSGGGERGDVTCGGSVNGSGDDDNDEGDDDGRDMWLLVPSKIILWNTKIKIE